jgi:hypothetical protein
MINAVKFDLTLPSYAYEKLLMTKTLFFPSTPNDKDSKFPTIAKVY